MGPQFEQFVTVASALCIVLAAAHLCGYLAKYLGQPKVVGEMIAGIMLGPSLVGRLMPDWFSATFTVDARSAIYLLSQIGLAAYMFLVGCELNLRQLDRRNLGRAAALSITGTVPSVVAGGLCGVVFFDQLDSGQHQGTVLHFAVFLGMALSVTAFPMLARIIEERGLAKTQIGVLALLAASIDDLAAWCSLPIIIVLAKSGSLRAAMIPLGGAMVFVAFCYFGLRPLLNILGRRIQRRGAMDQGEFAILLLLLLVVMVVTDRLGIYSIFGGFVLGVSMPRLDVFVREIRGHMYHFVIVFFLPMFFTNSGLGTNISLIVSDNLWRPLVALILVSFLTKYVFCGLAMRTMGFNWRESSAIGALFNARGLMLLIFANIGVAGGLIDAGVFAILVLVAIVTTAAAMPIFSWSHMRIANVGDLRGIVPQPQTE